jgi:hypothetical protein
MLLNASKSNSLEQIDDYLLECKCAVETANRGFER